MSREQAFGLFALVTAAVAGQIVIDARDWTQWEKTTRRTHEAPPTTAPQTANDLAPIFRCSGAGGQVVVSLGGDESSIFLSCPPVKS